MAKTLKDDMLSIQAEIFHFHGKTIGLGWSRRVVLFVVVGYYERIGLLGLSTLSGNGRTDLWGCPLNFPVVGGKRVGQVAYYHFSIRRARKLPVAVRVYTYSKAVRYTDVSPSGIRQGYRGCLGVLVVIGVGRTDHLNTRYCNHDWASSLLLFLIRFLALSPILSFPMAHSHRTFSPFYDVTVRGIPPDCYRRRRRRGFLHSFSS